MTEEQKRCADHSGFQEKFDAQEAFIARLKENETKMMEAIARMVPTHVLQYLILVLIPLFGGIFGLQAAIYQKITSVSTRIAVIETEMRYVNKIDASEKRILNAIQGREKNLYPQEDLE
ncbi:MAG TPA: hypothetical protein PKM59_12200 [Thermodesulfobacteriota bacterium]|nr:hypothetical protein [Thermodesulfobacteriota bacterium]